MKKIAWEEDLIHEVNLHYIYWIKQTQPFMIFFFISKSAMLKKSDLYLRKIQINF